jgi:pyridoxine kinase
MFAALMVVRLREAAVAAGLDRTAAWLSPDSVRATELPLARAAERALASMHAVLEKTKEARDLAVARMEASPMMEGVGEERRHLWRTKAAEVRLVRNLEDLRKPAVVFRAVEVEV